MNKTKEMTMKKKMINIAFFFHILLFWSCEDMIVEYKISDKYSGPCIVFIYPDSKFIDNKIVIKDGFSKVSGGIMKKKFIFKSVENEDELIIIPIGKIEDVSNDKRYIFRLTQGQKHSHKCPNTIYSITFFVGFKNEYVKWAKTCDDEHEYFESIGVDWCKYYSVPL